MTNQKHAHSERSHGDGRHQQTYLRFGGMIATSTVVMFGLTYANTYAWSHMRWSETRAYMALLMGGMMAIVMLSFMLHMHKSTRANWGIYAGSIAVMVLAIYLVRSQTTVREVSYMRAMIPHHSIAILTSERAGIRDPRVRRLADEIIEAQRREIKEMEWLIEDIRENGLARSQEEADRRPVPEFTGTAN